MRLLHSHHSVMPLCGGASAQRRDDGNPRRVVVTPSPGESVAYADERAEDEAVGGDDGCDVATLADAREAVAAHFVARRVDRARQGRVLEALDDERRVVGERVSLVER